MTAKSILELFNICISYTYFTFNYKLYKQINTLAMGATISGFAAETTFYTEKICR